MDGLGNFTGVTTDTVTENREHDLQNRLIGIDSTPLTYDDNGNLLEDDQSNEYTYDAWNRMITVNESARYAYDSLGRRVKEGDRTLVYSATWQVLEEQMDDAPLYQYVWSPVYVDAMVARIEYGSSEMMMMMSQESEWNPETREWEMPLELSSMLTSEPVQILYVLQDANFNVTALVADNGDVVERYVYDPYGKFEVYQGDDWQNPIADSNYAWVYLHQGGRWDGDAELFSFRNRDYSPRLMRWVEQDPIQLIGGDSNLYRIEANNPTRYLDPFGLMAGLGSASFQVSRSRCLNQSKDWATRIDCLQTAFDGAKNSLTPQEQQQWLDEIASWKDAEIHVRDQASGVKRLLELIEKRNKAKGKERDKIDNEIEKERIKIKGHSRDAVKKWDGNVFDELPDYIIDEIIKNSSQDIAKEITRARKNCK